MPFSTAPVREPSYYFPRALPPSPPPSIPRSTLSQDIPTPTTTLMLHPPRARLENLINLAKDSWGVLVAASYAAISIAAVIEDPSCLPRLEQVGNAFVGAVCAGVVILFVVALDGVDSGVENVWGRVWRWVKDWVGYVGDGEGEVAMLFDGEGGSVFVVRESESEAKGEREAEAEKEGRVVQMQDRSKSQAVAVGPPAILRARLSASPQEDNHASGLLDPSPIPPRRPVPEWKHFTGRGFWERQQEIVRNAELLHPGRTRTLEEITREVEEMEKRDREN